MHSQEDRSSPTHAFFKKTKGRIVFGKPKREDQHKKREEESQTQEPIIPPEVQASLLTSPARSPYITKTEGLKLDNPDVDTFFGIQRNTRRPKSVDPNNVLPVTYGQPPQPITPVSVNALLRSLAFHGKYDEAKRAFEIMQDFGIKPNVHLFTSLMSATVKAKKPDEAFEILEQMKEHEIEPNNWTFTTLINSCVKSGQLDRAFHALKLMNEKSIHPDATVYTTLIKGCAKNGEFERAWDIYTTALTSGLFEPDQVTYTTLINMCGRLNKVEKALSLFSDMKTLGLEPTEVTYTAAIHACARRPDYYSDALRLFDEMKLAGFYPDLYAVNSLLHAAERNRDFRGAEHVFLELVNAGYEPNIITYTSMISVHARACQIDSMKKKHLERCNELFQLMISKGITPDEHCLSAMLLAYTSSLPVNEFEQKYQQLVSKYGMKETLFTANILINAYNRHQQIEQTLRIYQELKNNKNMKLDEPTYRAVLKACADNNYIKTGIAVVHDMVAAGYRNNGELLNFLRVCKSLRLKEASEEVYALIKGLKAPSPINNNNNVNDATKDTNNNKAQDIQENTNSSTTSTKNIEEQKEETAANTKPTQTTDHSATTATTTDEQQKKGKSKTKRKKTSTDLTE